MRKTAILFEDCIFACRLEHPSQFLLDVCEALHICIDFRLLTDQLRSQGDLSVGIVKGQHPALGNVLQQCAQGTQILGSEDFFVGEGNAVIDLREEEIQDEPQR